MIFLESFEFASIEDDEMFCHDEQKTCYDTFYPFNFISKKVESLSFEPLTVLYGGNGSGKTTILNIIAESMGLKRSAIFNKSNFFNEYVEFCHANLSRDVDSDVLKRGHILTSDDVFEYMLNIREMNAKIDKQREDLLNDLRYLKWYGRVKMNSMDDFEKLRRQNLARRKSMSQYVRMNVSNNFIEHSNGESALAYFFNHITEKALYLLDEPENSLSAENQLKLATFLSDSTRFYDCQIILATHSPFLLAIPNAKIYDVDETPITTKKWTELTNIKTYYEFFKTHSREFKKK